MLSFAGIEPLKFCSSHQYMVLQLVSGCKLSTLIILIVTVEIIIFLFSDMWAMGAIMAELFTLRPLFPGSRYRECP